MGQNGGFSLAFCAAGIYTEGKETAAGAAFRRRKQSPYFDGVKEWTMPE